MLRKLQSQSDNEIDPFFDANRMGVSVTNSRSQRRKMARWNESGRATKTGDIADMECYIASCDILDFLTLEDECAETIDSIEKPHAPSERGIQSLSVKPFPKPLSPKL